MVACTGLVLLLEATRRAVGTPMTVLAVVFLGYIMLGQYMPEVLSHKGASLERMLSHQWLTTEGVYGVALGVSSSFIFIYVLFGALLDRAGAGNYMMQVSMALLGHMRGGPAKVAVVSSGLNGLISGSSVSNVVSGGIFTIPLMKKAGYGGVKAGAIETMSSVNGQIMPPVMGAAAFLMVEYVGLTYAEVCKHAFLPATLSYISLFYIVHLEALKLGLRALRAGAHPRRARARRRLGPRALRDDRGALRDLLRGRSGQEDARRSGPVGARIPPRRALRVVPARGREVPRPARAHRREEPRPARDLAHGEGRACTSSSRSACSSGAS